MKHIFSVWGHLTFYIAKRIIELDQLNPDDCIFVLARDYNILEEYQQQFKNQIHIRYRVEGENQFSNRIFAGANFIATHRNIVHFDSLIDSYTKGDSYIYYSANLGNDYGNLLVSNKHCQGYFVTEDGMGSYRDYNPEVFPGKLQKLTYKVLRAFYPRLYRYKHHFIVTDSPKFRGCIATQPQCFPLHQQYLRVIRLPFERVDLGFTPDCVLSIDPMHLYCDWDAVTKIYSQISTVFKKKNYKTIAYKFHPTFDAEANKEIKRIFNNIIHECFTGELVELGSHVVLENIFMSYQCDFYSDISSVGIYAHGMGSTCYTIYPIIKTIVPSIGERISSLVSQYYVDIPVDNANDNE